MKELEKILYLIEKGYRYDENTGNITNKKGKIINSKDSYGYQKINFRYKGKIIEVKAHRFAWYSYYQTLPANVIDHIDRNKCNNKIENLRDITIQQNTFNRSAKGYTKISDKYQAQIRKDGKNYFLGLYTTEFEAKKAYDLAKKQLHKI